MGRKINWKIFWNQLSKYHQGPLLTWFQYKKSKNFLGKKMALLILVLYIKIEKSNDWELILQHTLL
jgi:hypothetical protein